MRQIIGTTLRFMACNWYWYLGAAAMVTVMLLLIPGHQSASGGLLIAYGYLCLPVYESFLDLLDAGGPGRAARRFKKPRGYVRVSLLLFFVLPIVMSIAFDVVFSVADKPLFNWLMDPGRVVWMTLFELALSLLLLLPVFGTALPASVAGDLIGVRPTLARARRSFRSAFWRLAVLPLGFALVAALILIAANVGVLFLRGPVERLLPAHGPAVAVLQRTMADAEMFGAVLVFMIMSTVTIAVLCRAYLDAAGQRPAPAPATPTAPGAAATP
ncbi:hypothetical protein [Acidimangrovimonas sediminis]|uniref:hypothetical protein n=1 Tax=Acidimangrovimonas sediminis TaxID=2056283 RepID=UPI000C80E3E1|nr:hypothetical protein [Acidimangrovimonas sediminis]